MLAWRPLTQRCRRAFPLSHNYFSSLENFPGTSLPLLSLAVHNAGNMDTERETSDGLLYFGHRPIYKPQNTKLNYAHRQTNKTYKQQNTQNKYQQTDKNKTKKNKNNTKQKQKRRKTKQKTRGPNSYIEIMRQRHGEREGGRARQTDRQTETD